MEDCAEPVKGLRADCAIVSGVEPPWNRRFFGGVASSVLMFVFSLDAADVVGLVPKVKRSVASVAEFSAGF